MKRLRIARSIALFSALSLLGGLHVAAAEEAEKSEANPPVGPEVAQPAEEQAAALDALEQELAAVMDELVSARARAGVLAQSLFESELRVQVVRRAKALSVERVQVRLDGVPVHDSDGSALAHGKLVTLFTGAVAPGMHELGFEQIERAKDGASFGYSRSERYRIEVERAGRTSVELSIRDDSDMAEQAAEGDDGEYEVTTELRVEHQRADD